MSKIVKSKQSYSNVHFSTQHAPLMHDMACEFACTIRCKAVQKQLARTSLRYTYILRPGQTIATCQRNISQHCWAQHVACVWPLCCDMLGVAGSYLTIFKFEPTTPNLLQHGGETHTTCCAQQCCDMLSWHVVIVWPGLYMYSLR